MENFYFVEKNASSMKAFLKMFFEFHDFRVYAVNYNPANERIDIIMEYDNGEDKVLIRLEKDVDMNFYPTDDYAADWLYNCEVRLDETNRFVFIAGDCGYSEFELSKYCIWAKGENLYWAILDKNDKPIPVSDDLLFPDLDDFYDEDTETIKLDSFLRKAEDIQSVTNNNFSIRNDSLILSYADLIQKFPPVFQNHVKEKKYKEALQVHKNNNGKIFVSKTVFRNICNLDQKVSLKDIDIIKEKNFFNYFTDTSTEKRYVWYINFADNKLFGFYGSDLFAQDEIQTLEHPLLCSVREYLIKEKDSLLEPFTMGFYGFATPFFFENVPQWISVDTKPELEDGTVGNLYGNNFKYASKEEIEAGIKVINEDVKSNIIAMAAISGKTGKYTRNDIFYTFTTALCSFEKARFLSLAHNDLEESLKTVIHTGNWGCGVFGNDRELIYLIQMLAASLTGISEIYFHAPSQTEFEKALDKFNELKQEDKSINQIIDYLFSQNYSWHSGDGN